jgi:hypothetical protein
VDNAQKEPHAIASRWLKKNKSKKGQSSKEYEYSFYFDGGNGELTHISGASKKNEVTVDIDGKTFPLHISCSETFVDGYGEKGGPVSGVNPPVVNSAITKHKNGSDLLISFVHRRHP